jgi:hypothetical protein
MLHKHRLFTFSVSAIILLVFSWACTATAPNTETTAVVSEARVITSTPVPTITQSQPQVTGKLVLQRLGTDSKGDFTSLGLFELQGGWSEPREITDPGFDQSAISGRILGVSPDRRYIVFEPHFMLDTETGRTVSIPDTVETSLDYRIWEAAFSPDGHYLAYTVYPNYALFVMELISNTVTRNYKSDCTEYQLGGSLCEYLGDPSWINSNTLIFAHHKGLPFSYQSGSRDDPSTLNHVTVMTKQGEIILSAESPFQEDYYAIGDVVFKYRSGEVDAWLDGTDLGNGVYQPHNLCDSTEACSRRGILRTISRDGRLILSNDDSQWRIIEVRTGRAIDLGTRYEPECGFSPTKCLWSPDETQLVCLETYKDCKVQHSIILIPISKEMGGIIFNKQGYNWQIFDWRP